MSRTSPSDLRASHPDPGGFLPPPRQIRFVTSDGHPRTKRRRITAACLTCRKRKTRCSGERPECNTCTDNGHVCSGYRGRPDRRDGDTFGADAQDAAEDDGDSDATDPKRHGSEDGDRRPSKHQGHSHRHPETAQVRQVAQAAQQPPGDDHDALGDTISPASNVTTSSTTASKYRVPYFRYFGPTAIVPGFKQMVVQLKDYRRSLPSAAGESPAAAAHPDHPASGAPDRLVVDIPFYDAADADPNPPLITHLCETFFDHLGCNYPFLQRRRFMKDLEDKRVDAILVDAVCAVAARFSSSPLLCSSRDPSVPVDVETNVQRAFRGHPFSQRAMAAVVDTFSCPTMAVAQACLLLAYEEFGTDHDSGLWMYLGTAIRMAQDLGIQKLEGMLLEGRLGPTPKTAKHGAEGKAEERRRHDQQRAMAIKASDQDHAPSEDRRASEQERIDTFWAIFFLDRAVSSGVGRPVTLHDKDIEISFPYRPDDGAINGYPDPFPAMIQIVHMYGRVADVLNNIKDVSQVTPDVLKRLASMEKDLTGIYQRLSPRLHFNATNFQHYVKAGHGTNFILLHFWFHTLIVLVHQPTLLHSFEGRIQQLFPDSRELSMSSAKTIADILAFAELIDVKSFIGNPFTSQPMYVAACAFLAEAGAHTSLPPSRTASPPSQVRRTETPSTRASTEQRAASARHTLLATAANQNYQRCYKALKTLDSYWAGCRYILTALDQKSQGLMDPLLYTAEDIDGEMPSTEPSFTTPGWRSNASIVASPGVYGRALRSLRGLKDSAAGSAYSPNLDLGQAIGWSLTGTANSPAPNLSFLYPHVVGASAGQNQTRRGRNPAQGGHVNGTESGDNVGTRKGRHSPPRPASHMTPGFINALTSSGPNNVPLTYDSLSTADADLLLGLQSPYPSTSTNQSVILPGSAPSGQSSFDFASPHQPLDPSFAPPYLDNSQLSFNDMLIESQDIDMAGQQLNFTFPGGDMIPWLEYLPQDVLNYFGDAPGGDEGLVPSAPSQTG